MPPINLIVIAIPFFLLSIGLEAYFSARANRGYYRLNDALNDLSMGIYSQVSGMFLQAVVLVAYFGLYAWLYDSYRFWTPPTDSLWGFALWKVVIPFFLVDHQYYWFHRISHGVSVVWGSHEPHHQSEEYNLAVALRQGSFQGIFSAPFYLPLALIGIDPITFLLHGQVNTIYQFWIHTRAVKRLPAFIEAFLNTPSHHRVHHGINPKYIDKNHAGVLIIWDRLYGSFQPEEEEPVYGTVKPLASFNPMWANVQYWVHLAKLSWRTPGLLDKIKVWIMPPGWKPESLGGLEPVPEVSADTFRKYDPPLSRGMQSYALSQFILGLAALIGLIVVQGQGSSPAEGLVTPEALLLTAFCLLTLLCVGALMDRRVWAARLEVTRLCVLLGAAIVVPYAYEKPLAAIPAALAVIVLGDWFLRLRRKTGGQVVAA